MSDKNSSMFITVYTGRDTADNAYDVLRGLEKQKSVDIKTAAVVYRKANGKLKLNHKRRVTVWKGTFGGGAIGLVLAGLTAAGGGAVLAGAVVGALIGTTRSGKRRDAKKFLDDKLGQDDSALIILIKDADWETVGNATEVFGGDTISIELTPEAEAQIAKLAADEDVAEAVSEEVEVEVEEE